jgi:hypothetical protein
MCNINLQAHTACNDPCIHHQDSPADPPTRPAPNNQQVIEQTCLGTTCGHYSSSSSTGGSSMCQHSNGVPYFQPGTCAGSRHPGVLQCQPGRLRVTGQARMSNQCTDRLPRESQHCRSACKQVRCTAADIGRLRTLRCLRSTLSTTHTPACLVGQLQLCFMAI